MHKTCPDGLSVLFMMLNYLDLGLAWKQKNCIQWLHKRIAGSNWIKISEFFKPERMHQNNIEYRLRCRKHLCTASDVPGHWPTCGHQFVVVTSGPEGMHAVRSYLYQNGKTSKWRLSPVPSFAKSIRLKQMDAGTVWAADRPMHVMHIIKNS